MTTANRPAIRRLLLLGSAAAMLGVLLGAFGAHGLRHSVSHELLAVYDTGVRYHLIHALGVLLIATLSLHIESRVLLAAAISHLAGIVLFSGSLYALAVTGVRWLGAITPLGGVAFVLGWALLFAAVRRWGGGASAGPG